MDRQIDLNAVELIKVSLQKHVKKRLTEELVRDELKRYEENVRPIIEKTVAGLCFDHIDSFRNHMEFRDEYRIWLSWKSEDA